MTKPDPEHSGRRAGRQSGPERSDPKSGPDSAKSDEARDDEVSAVEEDSEEESVAEATRLSARLIYEVIRRDGEEELARPISSLVASGIAAGLLISFSLIGVAVFRQNIPDVPARFLIESLGYSLGFVLVISGRMQLFTENTVTTVLPVVARQSLESLQGTARLWTTVLLANVVGAFIAGTFIAWSGAFSAEMLATMKEISHHAMESPPLECLMRAMPAGMLIAALVWMLPNAARSSFWYIVVFAWLIAAGGFAHVVVGSVEMALLIVTGEISLWGGFGGFFLPALVGNIIGGTAIFTMLAWAQVRNELGAKGRRQRRVGRLKAS